MAIRNKHSDQHILRTRAQVLLQLRELCKTAGRSFAGECPLAPGATLGQHYANVLSKDAAKGLRADQVRELGRFANGLGLDGFEQAKWFLSTSQLHNVRVYKRVMDAIRKHARLKHGKGHAKASAVHVPAIDGLRLTVTVGRKKTMHLLSRGDSLLITLDQSDRK